MHTHTHTIKSFQINLHHSKDDTATLCQNQAEGKADVAFIQEPWIYRCQISGLTNSEGTVHSAGPENNARSCIYVRNHIDALPLLEYCSGDATKVRITYTYGGGCEELFVASAYLPYDSDEPPLTKEVRDIIDYCYSGTTRSPRTSPWWNKNLGGLSDKTRKLFNTAKRTGQWDTCKETLPCYNKEIRKSKRSSWWRYCQEINDVPSSARLMEIMAKQTTNRVSNIKLPDGQ
jgi:hypothetical protein